MEPIRRQFLRVLLTQQPAPANSQEIPRAALTAKW
jgi:hypothetical protein